MIYILVRLKTMHERPRRRLVEPNTERQTRLLAALDRRESHSREVPDDRLVRQLEGELGEKQGQDDL